MIPWIQGPPLLEGMTSISQTENPPPTYTTLFGAGRLILLNTKKGKLVILYTKRLSANFSLLNFL